VFSVLGMACATGKGKVERNKILAQEYLNKAAKLGDQKSIQMLKMKTTQKLGNDMANDNNLLPLI